MQNAGAIAPAFFVLSSQFLLPEIILIVPFVLLHQAAPFSAEVQIVAGKEGYHAHNLLCMPGINVAAKAHHVTVVVKVEVAFMVQPLDHLLLGIKAPVIKILSLQRMIGFLLIAHVVQVAHLCPEVTLHLAPQEGRLYNGKMPILNYQLLAVGHTGGKTPGSQEIQSGRTQAGSPVYPLSGKG